MYEPYLRFMEPLHVKEMKQDIVTINRQTNNRVKTLEEQIKKREEDEKIRKREEEEKIKTTSWWWSRIWNKE